MNCRSTIKADRFAAELRKEKTDRIGDPLVDMEKYIDFAALGAEVDRVAPCAVSAQVCAGGSLQGSLHSARS